MSNPILGHHARRASHVLTKLFQERETGVLNLSDREFAQQCNFPQKYLPVVKIQLEYAKLMDIRPGKHRATYNAPQKERQATHEETIN